MKFAVMQPYFLPYIGYFQLINAVDKFVIYDNIEFTKKGWINRNRMMVNGEPQYFSINLEKASDAAQVCQRNISTVFVENRRKVLARIDANYRKAEYYRDVFPLMEKCFNFDEKNLFRFIFNSIQNIAEYLGIDTELIISSSVPIDHNLKGKYKLWALADHLGIHNYVNPIGGIGLYQKPEFSDHGIDLTFHRAILNPYTQVGTSAFVPALSILDLLMNIGKIGTRTALADYTTN